MSLKVINHLIGSINEDSNRHSYTGYVHYSGIYRNGKPLHLGSNHLRSIYNGEPICFSTHAEMDVLHKVLKGEARTTI